MPLMDEFNVKNIWMLRPWSYTSELIQFFTTYSSKNALEQTLKKAYPLIAGIEEAAISKGIPIREPLQGTNIGLFKVMSPTLDHYLLQILCSDRTPEASIEESFSSKVIAKFSRIIKDGLEFVASGWGEEIFPDAETSPENEMSVIQLLHHCNSKILLTADAGRKALEIAKNYAPQAGITLPGIDCFQVPHHGSSKNVNATLLNAWIGPTLANKLPDGESKFSAIVSAAKKDPTHPRLAVTRAMWHRGAHVASTESVGKLYSANRSRPGWSSCTPLPYPTTQESE